MDETSENLIAHLQQLQFDSSDQTITIVKTLCAVIEMTDACITALEVLSARIEVLEQKQALQRWAR